MWQKLTSLIALRFYYETTCLLSLVFLRCQKGQRKEKVIAEFKPYNMMFMLL
jgi:hypothetical protein